MWALASCKSGSTTDTLSGNEGGPGVSDVVRKVAGASILVTVTTISILYYVASTGDDYYISSSELLPGNVVDDERH